MFNHLTQKYDQSAFFNLFVFFFSISFHLLSNLSLSLSHSPLSIHLELEGVPLKDPGQRTGLAVNAEDSLVVVLGVVGVLHNI